MRPIRGNLATDHLCLEDCRYHHQFLLSIFIVHEVEIKIDMLEVLNELATRASDLDDLGINLNANAIWDVHGL